MVVAILVDRMCGCICARCVFPWMIFSFSTHMPSLCDMFVSRVSYLYPSCHHRLIFCAPSKNNTSRYAHRAWSVGWGDFGKDISKWWREIKATEMIKWFHHDGSNVTLEAFCSHEALSLPHPGSFA